MPVTLAGLLAGGAVATATAGVADAAAAARGRRRRRTGRALMRLVARAGGKLGMRAPGDLAGRIPAAGLDTPVADVVALKGGLALVGAAAVTPLATAAPGRLGLTMLLAGPVAGYVAPDLWLRWRTRARRKAMESELPDVLELLRVSVAAGLPPRRALREVGRRHGGLLAAELRRAAGRASLGEPAETVLTGLAARCPANGVPSLVTALRRAERHGAPLTATLAAQAAEARSRRAQSTAEAAARAAPKIQLVVALLLVPAAMLLLAAALLPALTGR